MHPHGRQCGSANYPQWVSNIYPFRDRPDIPIRVLWYSVPDDRPFIPASHFRPHWYEARDGWVRTPSEVGVGTPDIGRPLRTDAREWQVAPGHYNVPGLEAIEGTPEQWARGTLYSDYLAGRYGPMRGCVQAGAQMIIGDRDALLVGGGRNEGAIMALSDRDGLLVGAGTGGSVPVVLGDRDGLDIGPGTGGAVSADLSDRDCLLGGFSTGGSVEGAFNDRDALAAGVATGGSVGATLSDRDGLEAGVSTGGSVEALLGERDCWTAEGAVSAPAGPGATCATAGTLALGTSATDTVPTAGNHWWQFAVVNGTTYRVRGVRNSGAFDLSISIKSGSCPTPSFEASVLLTGCGQWTATYTGFAFIHVMGGFTGSANYTITPDAGNCP